LGIGQREPVLVKLDKRLPAGPWDAVIDLKSGTIEHTAHATVTFPKATGSGRPVKANSLGKALSVFLPIAGLVAALFAAILLALWRRRRDKDDDADIKGDLRRFDKLMKQQLEGTLPADAEDPEVAIKAAIKQAGRARDRETERRLKDKLAEYRMEKGAAMAAAAAVPAAPVLEDEAPMPTIDDIPGPAPHAAPAVEPVPVAHVPVEAPPAAPATTPSAPPDLAEILAGVAPEAPHEPTRWSDLVDDIRNRKVDDTAPDAGDGAADAPSDAAQAVREAAERARKAAEDAATKAT
jgi:hypothetical protein